MSYNIGKLNWWVQRILPEVYDSTLSHYELLCLVMEKLNEVIDTSNTYFGVDMKDYVADILNGWYDDGTLANVINSQVFDMKADKTALDIARRGAIYVEDYSDLKITVNGGYDWSPAIQKALDDASALSKPVIFPAGQTLLVGTPLRIKGNNNNLLLGNGVTLKRYGIGISSDTPILYYTGLATVGGATKNSNDYNAGVFIADTHFTGEGFGVGYKHAIAGECYLYRCTFDTLEDGVRLIGTNGVHLNDCKFKTTKKGVFCARIAEDSYTQAYTSEGAGWNDGVYINGGMFTLFSNSYGLYYSGTTSEGVIKVSHVKIVGAVGAVGLYARAFTNFVVDGGWSEYFDGGKVMFADADSQSANYEADNFVVRNWQFTNYTGKLCDYSIYSRANRTRVEDCTFLGTPNQAHVYYSSGSPNTKRVSLSLKPTAVDTTYGTVTFDKTQFTDTRDLVINDGTNFYYLKFNADNGAGGYKYNTYTFVNDDVINGKEWKFGTRAEIYRITRITNPVLSTATTYTINSTDDTEGVCVIDLPIFQGLSDRSKAVSYGGYGLVKVKYPMIR